MAARPKTADEVEVQVIIGDGAKGPACRRCAGTGIDPLGSPAARQSPPKRLRPKDCLHPPTRRIGESCAACGVKVGKPDRRYGR